MGSLSYAVPLRELISEANVPSDFITAPDGLLAPLLDRLFFTSYAVVSGPDGIGLLIELVVAGEASVSLPGLTSFAIVFGSTDEGATLFDASFLVGSNGFSASVDNVTVALRFPPSVLKPVPESPDQTPPPYAQIEVHGVISLDENFDLNFEGFDAFSLKPVMIGNSGIIISADDVKLDFSRTDTLPEIAAAGFDESFMGVYIGEAKIKLPDGLPALAPEDLVLKECVIGSGGVSGKLRAHYSPVYDKATKTFTGNGAGALFGIPFGLKDVALEFKQNAFRESSIRGELLLPFFEEPVEVEIGIDLGGGLSVKLTSASSNGLYKLTKPDILELELDSIAFELKDGLFVAKLSGKLTPLVGKDKGLNWPAFDVKELSIDSKGHVYLDGGWLTLPQQQALNFYGFKIEIAQLGFGKTEAGFNWIGFSGALHLVDGLQAGASVEGLRITWNPAETPPIPKITLNGAGVELTIPDVLHLKGEVSFKELEGATPGEKIRRFDGHIHLTLETPEIEIDGTLVIGSVKGPQGRYNFFAIYVDVALPTGIPLASTGLAIYGISGLVALQMEPNKQPSDMWFSIDHTKSYYHHPPLGITDLNNKWAPRKGSFAIGAGITLGTLSDNGYTFNGKFLLAIIIPGPIVLIQGAASFLKKRADGQDEGQFRALAVFDGRAGSILIGLDAEYKTGKGGELIEIAGSMEAFYALHDPTAWHLYLGKNEPRELRIRALFGRFVEANAYFMLDAHSLALGAWFGYKNGWKFGPLQVTLEAWAEGNALLGFKPTHFHGDLWLHALVELSAFGLGLGISLDARIAADLFTPYHLRGEFSVGIKIPFRKKKIGATVVLEWGPRPQAPPLPRPVKQVAVEHLKSTVVWPLSLTPNWDDGAGFLTAPSGETVPDLRTLPRVPLDGRLSVTFDRSVQDAAKVGVNLQQTIPSEPIGSPGSPTVNVSYVLESLELHRWDDTAGWQLIAQSPKTTTGIPTLFGAWSVVPRLPAGAPLVGQTKLLCGVLTPFEFTRSTGSSMEEWASDALPDYPCIPELPSEEETCFGFGDLKPGPLPGSSWTFPESPDLTLSWSFGPPIAERRLPASGEPRPGRGAGKEVMTLCFSAAAVRRGLVVRSSEPGRSFRIVLARGLVPAPVMPAPPASQIRVIGTIDAVPATCVDLRLHTAGTVANPWSSDGVRFTVRGADSAPLPVGRIERWGTGPRGLNAGFQLDVELPCSSSWAELIVTHRPPFRIVAFNAAGVAVASHAPQGTGEEVTETIRLEGTGIKRLTVYAAGNEKLVHSVCYACTPVLGPWATGYGIDGHPYGPFFPMDGVIVVTGPEMPMVVITGDGPLCLEQVCIGPDPEAGQLVRREEVIQHIQEELARWKAKGEVLAPHTAYKLTIKTQVKPSSGAWISPVEHAYFRTEGPPGLTNLDVPVGTDTTKPFVTGLEDLTRYVRETDPPTVAPPGEKPILYWPFYRAYDVGVELNENYVEQMYGMDRRDLGLYLYDNNNQPVHDALGRLLALTNRWGQAETLTLSEKETRWLTLINAATCLSTKPDPQTFPHDNALAAMEPDRVLSPDTLHEARLVPLLFHETFTEGTPGLAPPGWYADDPGAGGPSQWRVMEEGEPTARHVEQASGIGGAGEPERPGTVLLLADPPRPAAGAPADFIQPSGWTDVRISVYVRSTEGGVAGVVFRHGGPGSWYRFALHERARRLVKATLAGMTVLAEDHFAWQRNRDYLLTVEAIGKSLRAYVDGEPVFAVEDGDLAAGRIGLYTCQSPGARFTDLRVDDFRTTAPVVYRFQFTTSLYANFFHHLHSFQDETWRADLGAAALGDLLNASVPPSFSPPEEKEARAYDDLAQGVLRQAAFQNPAQVEVTRLEQDGVPVAFLVRSPEPLAWDRIEFALSGTLRHLPAPETPGAVKLVEATFGAVLPAEESATLLLREAVDLTRQRIELRALPDVLTEPPGDPILLLEGFEGDPAATRARFTVVDQGTANGPSDWRVEGGALIQISEIGGGAEPELPGTVALAGDPGWTDYRATVDLRCGSGGTLGMVFRWVDSGNYYRLSLDAGLKVRRLVKSEDGQISILWEEEKGYTKGEPFRLTVEAVGSRLTGFLGDARLFEVMDATHAGGQVGLYCAGNPDARCESIEVRQPSLDAYALLRDRFAADDLTGWVRIDEALGSQPSSMKTSGGELLLMSFVQQGSGGDAPGTYAYAGDTAWADAIYSARLRCPTGAALGLVFRGRDLRNYYRFSMSAQVPYRSLVKRVDGTVTVLWQDDGAYDPDRPHEVTVVAVGTTLRGYLDGAPLFVVEDGDIPSGFIGLYSHDNTEARFSQVRVFPADRAFSGWRLDESFDSLVPGRWSFLDGQLQPLPDAWAVESGELRPAGADPAGLHLALTGDPATADYRVAVRLRPGTTGVVKVVLRFVDLDNYFFFSLDSGTGEQWWSKRVQGQEAALWHGLETVTAGREIGLTFDAVGESFAAWLDGRELFRLEDDDLPTGRVGFFAAGSPDVRFTEVRVAEPEWTTWYGFGGEDRRLAGTRIRISGGPEAGPVSAGVAEAGVERRVAAPLGETGRLRFPATGAELRIVGEDGPGHRRMFAAAAEYFPLNTPNVVRRADGTGLVLLLLGVSPLVKGYRLALTYRRERPGKVRAFSQAGDKGPEKVAIDIPWPAR